MHLPTWRYNKTHAPKLFKTKEEVEQSILEGWSDSPKVMYEEKNIVEETQFDVVEKQDVKEIEQAEAKKSKKKSKI
jgi:hypothetical protein